MNKKISQGLDYMEEYNVMSLFDEIQMTIPEIEQHPHLLISKVRQHYMQYVIQLLCENYENSHRLFNKNIYLPSAIWRCAKKIEVNAAQSCMVSDLYRKNILPVIKELKKDIQKGKLNKNLYDCLHRPPENEKQIQTNDNITQCSCQCNCNKRKKRKNKLKDSSDISHNSSDIGITAPILTSCKEANSNNVNDNTTNVKNLSENRVIMSVESHDSDDLMLQLEKIFQEDQTEEDIFESALFSSNDHSTLDWSSKNVVSDLSKFGDNNLTGVQDSVIETQAAQIKSLDARLASLAGIVNSNERKNMNSVDFPKPDTKNKPKKYHSTKWICEEYFMKAKLFELLDQVRDCNRKKLGRIKEMLALLFGEDDDVEGFMSPIEETPDFVLSCKDRIAPWVVKLLTPFYVKGKIKGKPLFKSLVKHLIRLIYQCNQYPEHQEVCSFVNEFLENHKLIRCEDDYKQFVIPNI